MHCGARGGACYIRVKQTFSHNCHEWETEIELATSGGHDTGESTTYISSCEGQNSASSLVAF